MVHVILVLICTARWGRTYALSAEESELTVRMACVEADMVLSERSSVLVMDVNLVEVEVEGWGSSWGEGFIELVWLFCLEGKAVAS